MSDSARSSLVRVACVQMRPEIGAVGSNLVRLEELCVQAAVAGAQLIVLPELCTSGYAFVSRDEAWKCAEEIPTGPASAMWTRLCQDFQVYVVAGVAERTSDGRLFNSSILVGPRGYVGTYRKVHLWDREKLIFEPGDLGFPVFHTEIGRIATFICYDGWFPESYRSVALRGADIVCMPTNWVPIPGQRPGAPAMATVLAQANAHSNSLFVAAADRIGDERGQPFVGQSVIVGHAGWPLAGPAAGDREEILLAEVDLSRAEPERRFNERNHVLQDRRPAAYRDHPRPETT